MSSKKTVPNNPFGSDPINVVSLLVFQSHVIGLQKLIARLDPDSRSRVLKDLPDLVAGNLSMGIYSSNVSWTGK